jgi:Carboxypeptidase regulatory-like domain
MKSVYCLFLALVLSSSLLAQTAILRGLITDESGAVIPGAKVTVSGPSGLVKIATSGTDGSYAVVGLPPGNYSVMAAAPDLGMGQPAKITLSTGTVTLNLQLKVAPTVQQVTIQEDAGPQVTTDPSNNASALVLSGNDLDALPDDPDDLQEDLQALAGPSAGPNGGQIYIDGFSGGEQPPKESIREIRINSNPFGPEWDSLGYGRIQIFTKPGSDKFHASGFFNFGDDVWNSRNPYAAEKAPFLLKEYGGNVSGPINKRASFFLNISRDEVDNGSIINAVILDPSTLGIAPFTSVFRTPQRRVRVSPRIDYQLSKNNTLSVRYAFTRSDITGANIGGFNLDDAEIGGLNQTNRGENTKNNFQTVQATETAVLGQTINETRFQYFRESQVVNPILSTPAVLVLGSFQAGGAQNGLNDLQNFYELQNYTSMVKKAHQIKFGVRLRGETDSNSVQQNFGGTYTFSSIEQYQQTVMQCATADCSNAVFGPGAGPSQYSVSGGAPALYAGQFDVGLFAGDDWKVRQNVTLSLGLRYETQTNIHDYKDFSPRIGLAWAPGATGKNASKTVIRAGFGIFYTRFDLSNTLAAERYNGAVQQQQVFTNPQFFTPNVITPIGSTVLQQATQPLQSVQEFSSTLRAPYLMQSAISVERQLPAHTSLAVTYTNSHGLHMFNTEDINAPFGAYAQYPLAGVTNPATHQPYGTGPVFLMQSAGLYNQNQLITNINSRMNPNVSLFGFYTLNYARSNTDGLSTSPAVPYSYVGEYGPASTDVRNRVFLGGSIESRWGIRFSPFITAQSGAPYNVTTGSDIYGDTLFNSRPGIVSSPESGADYAPCGSPQASGGAECLYGNLLLDPDPVVNRKLKPGEVLLPRNYGRGPGAISFNARLSKTFGFGALREGAGGGGGFGGPGGGGGPGGLFSSPSTPHRYNLTLSISARNLLNHNNPGAIIDNITSPLFGEANSVNGGGGWAGGFAETANNRRIELQARFSF